MKEKTMRTATAVMFVLAGLILAKTAMQPESRPTPVRFNDVRTDGIEVFKVVNSGPDGCTHLAQQVPGVGDTEEMTKAVARAIHAGMMPPKPTRITD